MKPVFFIVCLFLLLMNPAGGQESFHGLPAMCSYSSDHYHCIDQMWVAEQDNQGAMFFGNTNGIVRFDGNTWELIPISRFMSIVRSMEKNSQGTLFLGSINNFGYLQASSDGTPEFISLVSQLPPGRETFNDIWHIACLEDLTFFMASRFLFIFKQLKLVEIIEAKERFTFIEAIGESVYVHDKGTGIMVWEQNTLKPIAGGTSFRNDHLTFLVAFDPKTLLTGTSGRGIYQMNEGNVTPWGDSRFRKKELTTTCGIMLPDGTLAVGTNVSGIIFLNKQGEIIRRIGIHEGMISNGITSLYLDRDQNLWATTENGLTYLEINSPFTYYLKPFGLTQPVMESAWLNQNIYLAGTDGVYVMPYYRLKNPLEPTGFRLLEGSSGQSWQTRSYDGQLCIPHNPGLLTVSKDSRLSLHQLNRSNVYGIVFTDSSHGNIIASVDNGLLLVDKSNFSYVSLWTGKETPRYLMLNGNNELWMITETLRGIYRLHFSANFDRVILNTWYSAHKGLPDIPVLSLFRDSERIMALTEKGIYRYDAAIDRFVSDSLCNSMIRPGAYLANTDQKGNVWLEGMNYLSKLTRNHDGGCRIQDTIFRWINSYSIFHTAMLPDGAWLFSTNKGVIRYDSTRSVLPSLHQPIINEINSLTGDSVHFKRSFLLAAGHASAATQNDETIPEIAYSANSLRFRCASGCYGETRNYQFRYKTQKAGSSDSEWSEWTSSPVKEYTNLPEGSYSFRVVTRDVFDRMSREATFSFKILPPWYRTPWAYTTYFFIGLMVFYLAIRVNARHLKKTNLKLEQTVRDRTREIERQKTEIESLNEFKSRFFSNISHELRTPLTLIISPMEQMAEEAVAPVHKKRLLVMLQNGRKLLNLINQLLDLARLEKGGIRIKLKENEINLVLRQIIEPYSLFATEKEIKIIFTENEPNIRLPLDRDILEKIMDNLLSNALKFTDPGGEITIDLSLDSDKQRVLIKVQDTGSGIPAEELSRIFDRFYQVRDSGRNNMEGAGIGLAFVKELVVAHKGKISVSSSPGIGTVFTIMLPVTNINSNSELFPIVSTSPDPVQIVQELSLPQTMEQTNHVENIRADETILIVEDNEDMLHFIAENLTETYKVLLSRNGEEGLAVSRKEMPDLIITDVMMPKMDGFTFTRSIRNDRLTSHIPIIMLTAKSSVESRIEGLEAKADDYLTKPFSVRELRVRIRNLLSIRQALQKKYREALLINPSEIVSNSMDEAFLTKAIRLVEENMGDPNFGIELLYRELAMSRSSLHKKLKALTNQSATEFINMIRLKEAARLLRQQTGTVSEIAYSVGFSSIPYFNVCFKRLFGLSPKQYIASSHS